MGIYQQNQRTAADLTATARAAADLATAGYRLSRFLPPADNYSLTYQFDVNDIGLTDVAEYRAFDAVASLGQGNAGGSSRSGSLPPVSRKYRVKEKEQLDLVIGGSDLIGAKLDEYAVKGGVAVAARVALAQAQAIEFGKVTLTENKLSVEIDFGRRAGNSVTAATLFSDINADIISVFESWLAEYVAVNGGYPGTTLISQRILVALTKNKQIIAATYPGAVNLPTRAGYSDVTSFLANLFVTGIEIFDAKIDTTRLLSDDKIFFLPSDGTTVLTGGALGTTEWGITAESIQPVYGISATDRPGIFAAAFDDNDPQGTDVLSTAVVIPAVRNANAVFVAKVL